MIAIAELRRGWRGIALIVITYVYFLIFAEFAFLHRLDPSGLSGSYLKGLMAVMAAAGIGSSLFTAYGWRLAPHMRVRISLLTCALAAALAILPLTLPLALCCSALIGLGLGGLTITLVSHLRRWLRGEAAVLQSALGTGIAYFLCNFPPLFNASPSTQAAASALLCLAGIAIAAKSEEPHTRVTRIRVSFVAVLAAFTALVWLDSAAFFIIQNTPALKAGTWQGNLHLWTNATLHLLAAIACGLALLRKPVTHVLMAAYAALAAACLLLLHLTNVPSASLFYPVGVSLYSVALVAYPSLLSSANSAEERSHEAGWIYSIAGWVGSAMGIGMGQNLGHVPIAFVTAAGCVILLPPLLPLIKKHARETVAVMALMAVSGGVFAISQRHASPLASTAAERGRRVYISEGCMNCHSQYVRPHSRDLVMWGPAQTIAEVRMQQPPLIGNRRQGPDLSQVGARRSPLWLKAHFINPAEVSHGSFMPSYAHLFHNSTNGDDLVAYLAALYTNDLPTRQQTIAAWTGPLPPATATTSTRGERLYRQNCATCHDEEGRTRTQWSSNFHVLPPLLEEVPNRRIVLPATTQSRRLALARIVKFGLPGTDMPGHEYLPDADILAIADYLNELLPAAATVPATTKTSPGEIK